jgi:hypothetical protein
MVERTENYKSLEIWWISHLKNRGVELTNGTAGGDGLTGLSEESRLSMSRLAKIRMSKEEYKDPVRQAAIVLMSDEGHQRFLTSRRDTDSCRLKKSNATKKYMKDPETKERVMAGLRRLWAEKKKLKEN